MSWIKRNLSLVISGVIALALLGFGGWYLWSAMTSNDEVDAKIGQTKKDIEQLLGKPPAPSVSNLNIAKRELAKINEFIASAKKQFPASPPPAEALNNQTFKSLLETTVDELRRQATAAGTTTETNYYYAFDAQSQAISFPPESLRPLSERLHEVKLMASILFKARVKSIVSIKRATVAGEKGGGLDYLPSGARTNAETGMVLWPYELTFQCFTPDLASVVYDLERAPEGFIIKFPVVEPSEGRVAQPGQPPVRPPPVVRPGRGGPLAATNNAAVGPVAALNEKLLRVTLHVEVIKPGFISPTGFNPGIR